MAGRADRFRSRPELPGTNDTAQRVAETFDRQSRQLDHEFLPKLFRAILPILRKISMTR